MSNIVIRPAQLEDKSEWLRMRLALWPDHTFEELLADTEYLLANPRTRVFVAVRENGQLGGFLEGGLRRYAEGCRISTVESSSPRPTKRGVS